MIVSGSTGKVQVVTKPGVTRQMTEEVMSEFLSRRESEIEDSGDKVEAR